MDPLSYLLTIPTKKIKYGLSRTKELLSACDNPENNILSIQIVGTNGKGSVAAYITKILKDANYKVGLYTSPHLVDINERISINFNKIHEIDIIEFIKIFKKDLARIKPSFFEIMTVMALWYFKKNKVDIAVMETGLGGRLDSVTACQNRYVVFTPISSDHEDILGGSIRNIANEKAGAILNSKQVCISPYQSIQINNILKKQASKVNNTIHFFSFKNDLINKNEYSQYLIGNHQKLNAQIAINLIQHLMNSHPIAVNTEQIEQSIYHTKWPGRFQVISKIPIIIYDVAHNKEGLRVFIQTFQNFYKNHQNTYLICGFEENKKIKTMIKQLGDLFNEIICTETNIRKSMPGKQLASFFDKDHNVSTIKNVDRAITYITKKCSDRDIIVILGSHFFAPSINKFYKNCFAIHK